MARLCVSTHNQNRHTNDGAGVAKTNAIPCQLPNQVQESPTISNMRNDELIVIKKELLDEYVDQVQVLIDHHGKMSGMYYDAIALSRIIEETWQSRLDQLTDKILDLNQADTRYERGLIDAYNIMKAHV